MTHKDIAGNELNIGDDVYVSIGRGKDSRLAKRVVVGITPKMIKLDYILNSTSKWDESILRYPDGVIKAPTDPSYTNYEYGIGYLHHNLETDGPHRDGMETAQEAYNWIQDFYDMCPPGNKIKEVYHVIRKPEGKWERV